MCFLSKMALFSGGCEVPQQRYIFLTYY